MNRIFKKRNVVILSAICFSLISSTFIHTNIKADTIKNVTTVDKKNQEEDALKLIKIKIKRLYGEDVTEDKYSINYNYNDNKKNILSFEISPKEKLNTKRYFIYFCQFNIYKESIESIQIYDSQKYKFTKEIDDNKINKSEWVEIAKKIIKDEFNGEYVISKNYYSKDSKLRDVTSKFESKSGSIFLEFSYPNKEFTGFYKK